MQSGTFGESTPKNDKHGESTCTSSFTQSPPGDEPLVTKCIVAVECGEDVRNCICFGPNLFSIWVVPGVLSCASWSEWVLIPPLMIATCCPCGVPSPAGTGRLHCSPSHTVTLGEGARGGGVAWDTWGGDFATGNFRHGIFQSGSTEFAEAISHPHAVSRPLVGGGCCYLLMLCF